MADRHGGALVQQQQRHGLADDIAAPHHYRVFSGDRNLVTPQHFHDPRRRAGPRRRNVRHQTPDIHGMKPIHVFVGLHAHQNAALVHLFRKRRLHQNSVDLIPLVQAFDDSQQLLGGDGVRRRDLLAVDSQSAQVLILLRT